MTEKEPFVRLPIPRTPGSGHGDVAGVVKIVSDTSLARELITPSESFKEALSKTSIKDERKLLAIVNLKRHLALFGVDDGIEELCDLLNGYPSIGGYGRAQSVMCDTKVVVGQALGVSLDKHGVEELKKAQERRDNRDKREQQ